MLSLSSAPLGDCSKGGPAAGRPDLVADFGALGLWVRKAGAWSQLSGADELAVDFGSLGLWLWNAGAWTRISVLNPD